MPPSDAVPPDPEPARPVTEDGTELSEYAHPEEEVSQVVRRPSTIGGFCYLIVLGAVLTGVVVASTGRWRVGLVWVGTAVLVAAAVRVVLPESQTGMMHVRRRLVDVFILTVLGATLLAAALSIPVPPG